MEFALPVNRDDLIEDSSGYQVDGSTYGINELDSASLSARLDDLSGRFEGDGFIAITDPEVFDTLYGFAKYFSEIDQECALRSLDMVINNAQSAANHIGSLAKDTSDTPVAKLRSSTKMLMFLLNWMLVSAEAEANLRRTQAETAAAGKKKEKGAKKATAAGTDWDVIIDRSINVMTQLLRVEIEKIWSMGCVEEEFVNLFSRSANQLLESPANVKRKTTRDAIFHMLCILVTRYNHAIAVTTAIIHMLPLFEHLATPLAQMVSMCVKQYEHSTIVGDIIREIGRISCDEVSRDTSGSRNLAQFLCDLSELEPVHVLPFVNQLLSHLDGESYTMRNAVLGVLGNVLLGALTSRPGPNGEAPAALSAENRANRDQFLELLTERVYDTNAFVRSRVMQIWSRLCETSSIPLARYSTVVELAVGRVQDKTASVRKSSLALLTGLLVCNPYGAELQSKVFQQKLEIEKNKLAQLQEAAAAKENTDVEASMIEAPAADEEEVEEAGTSKPPSAVAAQLIVVNYFTDGLRFIQQLEKCIPAVGQLLGSKTATDVQEAIAFFVDAYKFGLGSSLDGVRKMLMLMWSKESAVRDAAIEAYKKLYCGDNDAKVAKNFITLTLGANLGDLTSLEELVFEFVSKGDIQPAVIRRLWDVFFLRVPNTQPQHARAALMILGMAARANPAIIADNLVVMSEAAFGARGAADLQLARIACNVMQKIAPTVKRGSTAVPFTRMAASSPAFAAVSLLLVQSMSNPDKNWYGFAEQAINSVYALSEQPDFICEQLLHVLHASVLGTQTLDTARSSSLARVFFVAGHCALKQLVHCEIIASEMKKRPSGRGGAEKKADKAAPGAPASIEDEMGQAAAQEDADSEYINGVCEHELVCGNTSLLAMFGPLLVHVCSQPKLFHDETLRSSAILCLCKFMAVSSVFCEEHLRLLFTVLQNAPEPMIRSNIVIALGDLAFRFPNLVEPWTGHIYGRLRDTDSHVRKNTLMMLTHLILNDMIKVRGQISGMAECLEDSDPRIAALARLFFHELARKGNAIYNILPDVISRMSSEENGVEEAAFQRTIGYLLSFIQKDRQTECLIEKLCHRFRASLRERQWRDIAFCLSQLSYTDKCVKCLIENFGCYHDKLSDANVFQSFTAVISKAKKFSKPELRVLVEELEARIIKCHTEGAEAGDSESKAMSAFNAAGGKGKVKIIKSSDDADESTLNTTSANQSVLASPKPRGRAANKKPAAAPAKKASAKSKKAAVVSEDEESEDDMMLSEDEEENARPAVSNKAKSSSVVPKKVHAAVPARGRARKAVVDDD